MSNLFKQRYVINLDTEKKVINSDDKFFGSGVFPKVGIAPEAKEDLAPGSEEILDGFLAGLNVEEVYTEPQPDPEEILAEAQAEAERILAEAQARAAQISNEASHQAELLYEQKRQEGYHMGVSQIQAELEEKSQALEMEYAELEKSLEAEYIQKLDSLEQDLVDVMIRVFNKVFHIQFDNKRQILLHLIKDALLGIDGGKVFNIHVSEANFKYIESHVADIKEKIGSDVNIDVVNDMTLGDESCIIETENGVYNCGMDMVLSNLEKDIRSLCL